MPKYIMVVVWLITAVVTLSAIAGCRSSDNSFHVSDGNQIILRLAEAQPASYPSALGAKEFAKLVEQKTGGRISIKVYDSGRLGDEMSVIEQVQFGGIDLARVSLASLAKYSPKVRLITLPHIFSDSDHMWKVFDGPFGADIADGLRKEKIICLAWYEGGVKSYYNSKKPINTVADLRGLKISVQRSPIIMDIYSDMGISLVPTPSNEMYSALQSRTIDGVEDSLVAYYTSKHYEVAKYFTYDGHARIPEVIIVSRTTMMQFSRADQEIIEQAAKESAILQKKIWLTKEKEAYAALIAMNIRISIADTYSKDILLSFSKPYLDRFDREEVDAIASVK